MLSQPQIDRLWSRKLQAEARSLYFAEIANRESTLKRWITGGTFVLGSATIVSLLAHMPSWISVAVTGAITLANGYQIAVNQESKIRTAGKLHLAWDEVECEFDQLWSNVHDDDAEAKLQKLQVRERDLSETGVTELGHNQKLWDKWWLHVCRNYDPGYEQTDDAAHAAKALLPE